MLRPLIVQVRVSAALGKAAAVEALQADEHAFRVILTGQLSDRSGNKVLGSSPGRQSRVCILRCIVS